MKSKVEISYGDEVFEVTGDVSKEGDLNSLWKKAREEFLLKYPDVSFFDERVEGKFDKAD